jgi:hypothetical protein
VTEGKRRAQGEGVLAGTHDFAPLRASGALRVRASWPVPMTLPLVRYKGVCALPPCLLLFFFLDAISPTRSHVGYS